MRVELVNEFRMRLTSRVINLRVIFPPRSCISHRRNIVEYVVASAKTQQSRTWLMMRDSSSRESRVFSRTVGAFRLTLPKFRLVWLTNQNERGKNFYAPIDRSNTSKLRNVKRNVNWTRAWIKGTSASRIPIRGEITNLPCCTSLFSSRRVSGQLEYSLNNLWKDNSQGFVIAFYKHFTLSGLRYKPLLSRLILPRFHSH